MSKTLRVRTRTGWTTKPIEDIDDNRLTAEEIDDTFLGLDDDKEPSLGTPGTDGYVLSSTTAGVRSWVEVTGGGGDVEEAPIDGNLYARRDADWFKINQIVAPGMEVQGWPDEVPVNPTLSTNDFAVFQAADTHESTDWQIYEGTDMSGTPVWESMADTTNKTTINVNFNLSADTEYNFCARHRGVQEGESAWSTKTATTGKVNKPSITSPVEAATDVANGDTMTGSAFSVRGSDSHEKSSWEIATDDQFNTVVFSSYDDTSNKESIVIADLAVATQHYARVRYYGADFGWSAWTDTVGFVTDGAYVEQPTLTVEGSPSDVPEQPTLTTGAFSVFNGSDTHQDTDWQILDSISTVVWESLADASNKTSIEVPADTLTEGTEYTFRVRHRGTIYGESAWGSVVATIIEVPGQYADASIGEAREGGFFAGRMNPSGGNIRYALITAPKASGESASTVKWKASNTVTPGVRAMAAEGYTWAHWDGERNTRICTLNVTTHAAADYADGLTIATHTDWYLPGADELELQYRNFKPDTTANVTISTTLHDQTKGFNPNSEPRKPGYTAGDPAQTTLTDYQTAGAESFEATYYWSSSENNATSAWVELFSNGDQLNGGKGGVHRVRAVRRHWLYPFEGQNFGDLISEHGGYWGGNVWDGVRTTVLGDTMTSTTSLEVGTGTKSLTIAGSDDLTPTLWIGRKLRFVATGKDRSNAAWMTGAITDINTSTRVVTITCTHILGSGTHTAWALVGGQALIVAPKAWGDVGTFAWKDANTAGPTETQTLTNGPAATAAMINAGTSTVYPAAHQVAAMNAFDAGAGRGGFADWYMPSRDELHTIGYTLCPTLAGWTQNTARTADVTYNRDGNVNDSSFTEQTNWHSDPIVAVSAFVPQTHKDLFKVGGTECFEAASYWSSSEGSAMGAWLQTFDSGTQFNNNKTNAFRVRAVRRVAI